MRISDWSSDVCSSDLLSDEPIRVEVLDREEIEEKLMMTPGNIAMMVSETPGVRTQITSPSLGAASIRMQGLKGRYTQLLADGLPLYGGQRSEEPTSEIQSLMRISYAVFC